LLCTLISCELEQNYLQGQMHERTFADKFQGVLK
jgi:hypothetical protein